jgi:triacylglycerol esterase/lipase EstA (alpha/beta hydrolase family)
MPLPSILLPGYLAGASDYTPLQQHLQSLGYPTWVVPLRWQDWLQTLGGRSVTPIIRQLDATVQQAMAESGADRVNLIGHSAGGWVARIYLGDQPYAIHAVDAENPAWDGYRKVHTLISLGTPHISQERWTLKNLNFVNQTYPGAFHASVRYVCVAGKTFFGRRWRVPGGLAYSSYQLTCGVGESWGDGITPIAAAHLEGAENLVIEGAQHSPRGDRLWYGSPSVLSQWVEYLA